MPACGSTNLIEGRIMDDAGSSSEFFAPKDKSAFLSHFGVGTRKVLNFACVHCGNLQFAVQFNDDDKRRYAEFEGEQPGIIERLNLEHE